MNRLNSTIRDTALNFASYNGEFFSFDEDELLNYATAIMLDAIHDSSLQKELMEATQ